MNKERLEHLITALELEEMNGKVKNFNMGLWAHFDIDFETLDECEDEIASAVKGQGFYEDCLVIPPNACATAACAFGTAALYEPLYQEGLTLITSTERRDNTLQTTVYYDGEVEFAAASKFFEITNYESEFLFDPADYCEVDTQIKRSHVIRRIRWILNGNDARDFV